MIRCCACALVGLTLSWPAWCRAQAAADADEAPYSGAAKAANEEDVERARDEFRRASALARAEHWAEALSLYATSYRSYAHATTLYNLGFCHEKLGDSAAAFRDTLAALALSKRDAQRALDAERRAHAEAFLVSLRARTARVSVPPPRGSVIASVHGARLTAIALNTEELWFIAPDEPARAPDFARGGTLVLNPGHHRLEVRANTGETTHFDLTVASDSSSVFAWPERTAQAAQSLASERGPRLSVPPRQKKPVAEQPSTAPGASVTRTPLRPWAIGSFALAGAGGAAALVGGLVAIDAKSELDQLCESDGSCPSSAESDLQRFDTAAAVATAGAITAAIATVAGVSLLVFDARSRTGKGASLRVKPGGYFEFDARF